MKLFISLPSATLSLLIALLVFFTGSSTNALPLTSRDVAHTGGGFAYISARQLEELDFARELAIRDEFDVYEAIEARRGGGDVIVKGFKLAIEGFINLAKGIKQDKKVRLAIIAGSKTTAQLTKMVYSF